MSSESTSGTRCGNETAALRVVIERLRAQFPELTVAQVEAAVSGQYDEFDHSPIRDLVAMPVPVPVPVPVLVERSARDELSDHTAPRAEY